MVKNNSTATLFTDLYRSVDVEYAYASEHQTFLYTLYIYTYVVYVHVNYINTKYTIHYIRMYYF